MPEHTDTPPTRPRQRHVVKPVRVTVDLEPADYDTLREFAHAHRLSHSMVLRRLVGLLGERRVASKISHG
jgi:hypothetical protein